MEIFEIPWGLLGLCLQLFALIVSVLGMKLLFCLTNFWLLVQINVFMYFQPSRKDIHQLGLLNLITMLVQEGFIKVKFGKYIFGSTNLIATIR